MRRAVTAILAVVAVAAVTLAVPVFGTRLTNEVGAIDGDWTSVSVYPTTAIAQAVACGVWNGSSKAFIVGGSNRAAMAFADSYSYNFTTNKWERLRSAGLPRTSFANLAILTRPAPYEWQQRLYLINGYSLEGNFNPSTYIFSQEKSSWSEIFIQGAPSGRRAAGVWFHDDIIVVFGGATSQTFDNNIMKLTGAFTDYPTWTETFFNADNGGNYSDTATFALAPSPRFGQCCQYAKPGSDHLGICFGGTTKTGDSDEIWSFNEVSGTWTKGATLNAPSRRSYVSCGYDPTNKIFYIYGGYSSDVGGTKPDTNVYRYDVAGAAWLAPVAQTAVSSVSQAAGCFMDGHFLFVGGVDAAGTLIGGAAKLSISDNKFVRIAPKDTRDGTPTPRAGHNAIAIGDDIFVMFGADGAYAYNDVWKYATQSSTWTKVTLTAAAGTTLRLPARYGATMVSTGTTCYIFGGASLPIFEAVEAMVVVELTALEYRIITPQADAGVVPVDPPVRLNHVMMLFSGNMIVVGSGMTTGLNFAAGWFFFNIETQRWGRFRNVTGEPGPRYGASVVQVSNTQWMYGLGYGRESNYDWYFVTIVQPTEPGATTQLLFTRNSPQLTFDADRRRVIRLFAATVISGSQLFIFGGQTDPETPPARATLAYQYNLKSKKIFPIRDPSVSVSGAQAVMVRDKIYLSFGRTMTNAQLLDEYSDAMQVFAVNPADFCLAGASTDAACIYCGAGTVSPSCVPVAKGQYLSGTSQTPQKCKAGTFLPIEGASSESFCLKCPAGKYSSQPGATECTACRPGFVCPMGSSEELSSSVGYGAYLAALEKGENKTLFERNPAPYSAPSLPLFPTFFVGVTTLVLATALAIFVLVNRHVWRQRVDFFVPESVQADLAALYDKHATHIAGMSESNFIEACHDTTFPPHDAHAIELQKLFFELDVKGANALDAPEFVRAVIMLIERGKMPLLEGSEAHRQNTTQFTTWVPDRIRDLEMSSFDLFADAHRSGQPGDEVRNMKTYLGGTLSLSYIVIIVILVLAIIIDFVYGNVQETRAAVPRAVIQSAFDGDTLAKPSTLSVRVAVVGPLHGKPLSALRQVCIAGNISGRCNGHTAVTVSGVVDPQKTASFNCTFIEATEECEVEWTCRNCRIPTFAKLLFEVSPYHSGDVVRGRVVSTTGIRDPDVEWTGRLDLTGGNEETSWVERRIKPTENSTVLTGSPPTVFKFGVTSTFVEANEVWHNVDPTAPMYLASGYMVRPNGNPVQGNAVEFDAFDRFHGVPIQIEITADVTPLFVRRVFIQSSIQLIVSLLGAISGLGGGIVAIVQATDEFFGVNENSQRARDEQLVELEGVQALYDKLPPVEQEDVEDILFLVKNDFRPSVARELVEMMREAHGSLKQAPALPAADAVKPPVQAV